VLKWFRDNFAADLVQAAEKVGLNPYAILDERARQIRPGSDGLIMNEYFQGNRTPYSDSRARGVISGLSLMHTPAHVYKAILEAVCYGTALNLRSVKAAGMDVNRMVACGGATKSRDWIQMHADVSGVPITLTEVGDAVVLGTCMLAAVGAGAYESLNEAADAMVNEIEVIQPNDERHEEYGFYVDRYAEQFQTLQPMIHEVVDHEINN
jgi:sugar (pentulose or hexulose) kinase